MIPQPSRPLNRAVLRKATVDFCRERDRSLGRGICRIGIESGYRFCGWNGAEVIQAIDHKSRTIEVTASTIPQTPAQCRASIANAAHFLIELGNRCAALVFNRPPSGDIPSTCVIMVCPNCAAAVRQRLVGVAGNANERLAVTDARDGNETF